MICVSSPDNPFFPPSLQSIGQHRTIPNPRGQEIMIPNLPWLSKIPSITFLHLQTESKNSMCKASQQTYLHPEKGPNTNVTKPCSRSHSLCKYVLESRTRGYHRLAHPIFNPVNTYYESPSSHGYGKLFMPRSCDAPWPKIIHAINQGYHAERPKRHINYQQEPKRNAGTRKQFLPVHPKGNKSTHSPLRYPYY